MRAAAHQALHRLLVRRPCVAAAWPTRLPRRGHVHLRRPPSSSSSPLATIVSLRSSSYLTAGSRHLFAASVFPAGAHGPRRFSNGVGVRAAQVNDPGAIDSPLMQAMEKKIKEQLNAEMVIVKDAYGDGRHVSIDVVSSAFEGQSAVNRQRMVYQAIWEELQSTVHAVDQMTTRTPGEAAGNQ